MPEEIDLRHYLNALLRAWWFILLCTLLAAALTYGISKLLPRQYEAGALVVATSARTTVQFDTRIATQNVQISSRGYPDLALSDELLQRLLAEVRPEAPEVRNLSELAKLLESNALADPALLELSVTYDDPAIAPSSPTSGRSCLSAGPTKFTATRLRSRSLFLKGVCWLLNPPGRKRQQRWRLFNPVTV